MRFYLPNMKRLLIGFKGKHNTSSLILDQLDVAGDQILLTNSIQGIKKDLNSIELEAYDFIFLFGCRKQLENHILLELVAGTKEEVLESSFPWENFSEKVNRTVHFGLCNTAYYEILKRNKNAILIHIPSIRNVKFLPDISVTANRIIKSL